MTHRVGSIVRAPVALALVAALVALAPGRALAHPRIDEARTAYDSARHAEALEKLEEALAGSELSRDELADLFILRAMIHRAQGHMDLAEVDLLRLASLDPTRELGREVHPSLRRAFASARERVPRAVGLQLSGERDEGTVRIAAAVVDDIAALTQGFRLHARREGGAWQETTDSSLTVDVLPSEAVEYWAEGIGPGGAPIATRGSISEPLRVEPVAGAPRIGAVAGAGAITTPGGAAGGAVDQGEGLPAWPFVVGGVVLVVAAGVVLGVYFGTQPTDETQLEGISVSLTSAPPLFRF
ncbi:MAG: hypothetical protein M3Y87_23615 [Myxococcota bacterium]|nr:hypothetical protein [Myxococcota bacterium]